MSDCAPSGAAADASATTSGTNATRFMTDLPFRFRIPQSAFRNFLAPLAHPLVVQHRHDASLLQHFDARRIAVRLAIEHVRSEEHTSELQSPCNLVCRLLLEKKKNIETEHLL